MASSSDVKIEEFVKNYMTNYACGAHDFAHCTRVANIAEKIAQVETNANPRIAYLCGLLHDVFDTKLNEDIATAEAKLLEIVEKDVLISADQATQVIRISKSVGFKNMIKEGWNLDDLPIEYKCVQDADFLDAIGAIGVARCFAYGGKKKRPLFSLEEDSDVMTHERYMREQAMAADGSSSLQHFFDKLLRIPNMMTTVHGAVLAEQRLQTMTTFLRTMQEELEGAEDINGLVLGKKIDAFDTERKRSKQEEAPVPSDSTESH